MKFAFYITFWAILMLSSFSGYTDTEIQGKIAKDAVLYFLASPYIITENITINESATLTIEPGVQVRFDGNYELVIEGALNARGTPAEPIIFTSDKATPARGDWQQIYFTDSSRDDVCILEHCIIEYADVGVRCRDASPTIINSIIKDNLQYGVRCEDSSPTVIHNIISENGKENTSAGISLYGPKTVPVISYNIISHNKGAGIHARLQTSPKAVSFNTIINNSAQGIYCIDRNRWSDVNNNNIYGNGEYDIYNRQSTHLRAPSNYWGFDTTRELITGGLDANITRLYDFYEQDRFGRIFYEDWRSEYINIEQAYKKYEQERGNSSSGNSTLTKPISRDKIYSAHSRGYIVYVYSEGDRALIDYNVADNIEKGMTFEVQRDGIHIGSVAVVKVSQKTSEAKIIDALKPPLRGDRIVSSPIIVVSDDTWLASQHSTDDWKAYQLLSSERRHWSESEILTNAEAKPTEAMRAFMEESAARVIWSHATIVRGKVYFRKRFDIAGKPSDATFKVIAANPCDIYLNEQWIGRATNKNAVTEFNVITRLKSGSNVIAIMVERNTAPNTPVGILCELIIFRRMAVVQ